MRQPVPFGKYLLLDRISVGGMAEVFKAKSYGVEGFEKVIAIKRILPSMGEDRDFIKMFIDEAKIAGQLSHANICQIFELGKISGAHFIAMEYIWGKDLLQIQNRAKRLGRHMPVPMACHIIAKACEGLHYAHKKRDPMGTPLEIVHRDCSPQNILISYEGEVKVIDFGIARAASRSSRTQAGVLKGKFGYMSPEQVRGLPLDQRSDIFSLGTVLYESLTGERLFVGESDFSTLEKVRNAEVTPPRELNHEIPEEVERIVLKALSRDRDKRYQWCSEMQGDLVAYLTAQAGVFTSKGLSEVIREMFAKELAREKSQLEQYKRVGRDGLIKGQSHAEAEGKLAIDEELGEAPPLEGDPTMLGGPDFAEIESAVTGERAAVSPGLAAAARLDISDAFEEHPTEIFGDGQMPGELGVPQRGGPDSRPTAALKTPPPEVVGALSPRGFADTPPPRPPPAGTPAGQQRLASASNPPPPVDPSGPLRPGEFGQGAPISHSGYDHSGSFPGPPSRPGGPYGNNPAGPVAMSPSYPRQDGYGNTDRRTAIGPTVSVPRQRRRSAARDVAIGVGIAALVLAAFALGRSLLAGGDDDEAVEETGAIAVVIDGVESAEVLLDGKVAGKVSSGNKLMLSAGVGDHRVEVRAADAAEPCVEKVEVTTGGVSEIRCAMAPASKETPVDAAPAATPDAGVPTPDAATSAARDRERERDKPETDAEKARRLEREARRAEEREKREAERREREKREREKREREKAMADEVGWLVCNSTPFARVIINGRSTGKMTPMSKSEKIALKPGRHKVTFVVGEQRFTYGVTIVKGKTKTLYRALKVK